ncbi:hypothetical protein BC332_34078 [Capsicum chinense]|nr:hypothetical protein BC332_34078 [Capsicum chinense]
MYPHLAASFECLGGMLMIYQNGVSWLKEKMSLVTSDKAKVLEEKWKKLDDVEAALILKHMDLIMDHYGLVVYGTRGKPSILGIWNIQTEPMHPESNLHGVVSPHDCASRQTGPCSLG